MGNSTVLSPSRISSIAFDKATLLKSTKHTIEEYRNFKHASPEQKYFLISLIYPCFINLFSSFDDFSALIQVFFYSPTSFSSTLFISRLTDSNEVLGFSILNYFEVTLDPSDTRNQNKYIAGNGFGCIKKAARGEGLQKSFFILKNKSDIEYFKDRNILLVDVSINPMSYYGICQISKTVYPKYNQSTPMGVEKIFEDIMRATEYESLGENNKFLVKDSFTANENLLARFRGKQDGFPEDIKFFNEATGLREYVGLGFVSVVNLVEGNTLGLPPGDYTAGENEIFDLRKVDFNKPRI